MSLMKLPVAGVAAVPEALLTAARTLIVPWARAPRVVAGTVTLQTPALAVVVRVAAVVLPASRVTVTVWPLALVTAPERVRGAASWLRLR